MKYTKIALSVCSVSTAFLLSACGGSSSGTSGDATATFVDSPVENLRFSCNTSGISGVTDANGKFSCNYGDNVSFQLGAMTIGPVDFVEDMVITPYKLYPTNATAAVRLAQLIQSLDDDGDISERITIVESYADAITEALDPTLYSFEAEAQALLDTVDVTLVDSKTAKAHLSAQDTSSPVVTLQGDAQVTLRTGDTYMDAGATAYDAFDGSMDPVKSGSVNTSVAGTYTITYTATDQAGNTGSISRTVIVVADTVAPVVTLQGDATVTIKVGESYTDAGATATDDLDGVLTPVQSGSVDTSTAGTYTVTWTATDTAGNIGSASRTVIVVEDVVEDTTPPVVTLNGDASVTITVGSSYSDAGATATDNVDGALTPVESGSVDTSTPGTYTVTWTATDNAGNVGSASRTVVVEAAQCQNVNPITGQCEDVVEDTTAPVVTLNGDASVTITVGDSYSDAGATATDNVDGALTPVKSGSVNTSTAGTYTVTWTATDTAGNVGSVSRTVIVEEAQSQCQNVNPITGQCEDVVEDTTPPVVTLNGDASVTITVGDSYSDAGASATDNVDGALTPVESGSVDTSTPGTYTITWTATDNAGNVGSASRTVVVEAAQCQNVNPITGQCEDVVEDTTAPVVTLNGDASVTITVGDSYSDAGASATDNVDGTLTPVESGSVDTSTPGTYTVTWTATDNAGNVGSASRTVVVEAAQCQNVNPITGQCED
ncbi:DUF5011 domain-containing protein [Sulfurovum mangrovi]|uniref:DUF5011 domain-containing protein n=1 Tax=Sulfurovum mangrovi TaxID=2893889 RepID=UPI001E4EFBBC|nr:DUF5011 domain-containing protein [Sulfurovum mangrovi]UFH59121.1 DUF5011 domain-containing protein [Sulfurovum mangrovi]